MAKTVEAPSTSFKIWRVPEEVDRKTHTNPKVDETRVNEQLIGSSAEKQVPKMMKFPHRSKSKKALASETRTKTPESVKTSSDVPKAPIKPRRTAKKIDAIPKRLEYPEAEDENVESTDSAFGSSNQRVNHRYPTRARISIHKSQNETQTKNCKPKPAKPKSRKNLPDLDKENDGSAANRARQQQYSNAKRLPRTTENSSVLQNLATPEESNSNEFERLSECSGDDWIDHMRWYQPRRDIGLWVECCQKQCEKWRYVEKYHDPVDVPNLWYCNMNDDLDFADCAIPEQEASPAEVRHQIMNVYNAGSIVWAKIKGFPWWPAMVDECPNLQRFYELHKSSLVPYKYHVTFFNSKKVEYAWVVLRNLKPYVENPKDTFIKKVVFKGKDYSTDLDDACKLATQALPLSILKRLKKCSLASRISAVARDDDQQRNKRNPSPIHVKLQPPRKKRPTMKSIAEISAVARDDDQQQKKRNPASIHVELQPPRKKRPTMKYIPEVPRAEPERPIMNAYNAGSIVWARLNGYPWWPAMVDECPNLQRYQIPEFSIVPGKYNVTFFNSKKAEYAWMTLRNLKPYEQNPRETFLKKVVFRRKDYSEELDDACKLADQALRLSIGERLDTFSYASRVFGSVHDNDQQRNEQDNAVAGPSTSKSTKRQEAKKDFTTGRTTINVRSRIIDVDTESVINTGSSISSRSANLERLLSTISCSTIDRRSQNSVSRSDKSSLPRPTELLDDNASDRNEIDTSDTNVLITPPSESMNRNQPTNDQRGKGKFRTLAEIVSSDLDDGSIPSPDIDSMTRQELMNLMGSYQHPKIMNKPENSQRGIDNESMESSTDDWIDSAFESGKQRQLTTDNRAEIQTGAKSALAENFRMFSDSSSDGSTINVFGGNNICAPTSMWETIEIYSETNCDSDKRRYSAENNCSLSDDECLSTSINDLSSIFNSTRSGDFATDESGSSIVPSSQPELDEISPWRDFEDSEQNVPMSPLSEYRSSLSPTYSFCGVEFEVITID